MNFDFDKMEFSGVTEQIIVLWSKAYPACDIDIQLAKAAAWLVANPKKKKKNYLRFMNNWLSKAQERGGDIKSNGKLKLFPIAGKNCKCGLPAVYKSTGGEYDSYYCADHMPEKVREQYA